MGVLVTDSFAFYDVIGDVGDLWTLDDQGFSYDPNGGQWGTGAIHASPQAGTIAGFIRKSLTSTSCVLGFRVSTSIDVSVDDRLTAMATRAIFEWVDDGCSCSNTRETPDVKLHFNTDGTLTVTVDSPFATDSAQFFVSDDVVLRTEGSFYYIELTVDVASDGTISGSVFVEDEEVLTYSHTVSHTDSCCTLAAGFPTLDYTQFSTRKNETSITATGWDFHDAYVSDGNRLGPVRSRARRPEVDNVAQWTPKNAGANWEEVDEKQKDDDTTHNRSETVGDRDEFECGPDPSPGPPEIFTLATVTAAKADTAGAHSLQHVLNGSLVGSVVSLPDVYEYEHTIFETNPATGDPWTAPEADAATMGYELQ